MPHRIEESMSGNSPAPPQGRDKFDAWLNAKTAPELEDLLAAAVPNGHRRASDDRQADWAAAARDALARKNGIPP